MVVVSGGRTRIRTSTRASSSGVARGNAGSVRRHSTRVKGIQVQGGVHFQLQRLDSGRAASRGNRRSRLTAWSSVRSPSKTLQGASKGTKTKQVTQTVGEPIRSPGLAGLAPSFRLVNTLLLSIATFMFVLTSWTFRSSLKSFDQACIDTTAAMKATEKASKEVETMSLQMEREIPVTLVAVENASIEVEMLAQGLQSLTGSVNRNIRQPVQDAVAATVDTSTSVMKRVPTDLQYVSDVATMVLGEWTARLGDTIGNMDTSFRRTKGQKEASEWIKSWRARTAAMEENGTIMSSEIDTTPEVMVEEVEVGSDRKEMAENKVALALSAAEAAAAQAEIASGRLQRAMREYQSVSSVSSVDDNE